MLDPNAQSTGVLGFLGLGWDGCLVSGTGLGSGSLAGSGGSLGGSLGGSFGGFFGARAASGLVWAISGTAALRLVELRVSTFLHITLTESSRAW